jgi:DNA-binding MarR family transcriptional regulator
VGKSEGPPGLTTVLVRAAFLVNAAYTDVSRQYGISPAQAQFLAVLRPRARGTSELVAVLGLAKSTVTGMVNLAERNGLVRREADPADSRAVRVGLTAAGRTVADGCFTDTSRRIEQLSASLTADERATLAALLRRVTDDNQVSAIFPEA